MGQLPLSSPDFKSKRTGTAGEREDEKLQAIGLHLASTDGLARQLEADFLAADYGYRHFEALEDPLMRAIASSRVRAAIRGVGRNLLEARLHEHHVCRVVGPNGIAWPGHETSITDDLELDEMQMHIADFFRSIGSTFDCLAAVLIGVARVPASLQRADFRSVLKLEVDKAARRVPARPAAQDQLWEDVRDLARSADNGPPENWLEWTLQMRNALVHRGRGLFNLSARQPQRVTPIYISGWHGPHTLVRYDPHLARQPMLSDVQSMLLHDTPFGHWLGESAPSTITGIRTATNAFCEEAARWALDRWCDQPTQAVLHIDRSAWNERRPVICDFSGFNSEVPSADTVVVSPDEHELIELVQRLQKEGESV